MKLALNNLILLLSFLLFIWSKQTPQTIILAPHIVVMLNLSIYLIIKVGMRILIKIALMIVGTDSMAEVILVMAVVEMVETSGQDAKFVIELVIQQMYVTIIQGTLFSKPQIPKETFNHIIFNHKTFNQTPFKVSMVLSILAWDIMTLPLLTLHKDQVLKIYLNMAI